jgi:hypothetical protein
MTPLFNPRAETWGEHSAWDGLRIIGRTSIGQTAVRVLDINASARLRVRRATRMMRPREVDRALHDRTASPRQQIAMGCASIHKGDQSFVSLHVSLVGRSQRRKQEAFLNADAIAVD